MTKENFQIARNLLSDIELFQRSLQILEREATAPKVRLTVNDMTVPLPYKAYQKLIYVAKEECERVLKEKQEAFELL